uniref:P-type domain-containing protein n=1 Tax=Buteo japonicus TaxID=224669 RepID=A0A8C0C4K3_9AVES
YNPCCAKLRNVPYTGAFSSLAKEECKMHPKARENRGFLGITKSSSCLQRMCCFDPPIPNVPWCFRPVSRRSVSTRSTASSRQF